MGEQYCMLGNPWNAGKLCYGSARFATADVSNSIRVFNSYSYIQVTIWRQTRRQIKKILNTFVRKVILYYVLKFWSGRKTLSKVMGEEVRIFVKIRNVKLSPLQRAKHGGMRWGNSTVCWGTPGMQENIATARQDFSQRTYLTAYVFLTHIVTFKSQFGGKRVVRSKNLTGKFIFER